MGFGELIRNITVTQTDTLTGETFVDTIVTGTGAFSENFVGGPEFRGMLGLPAAWRATQLLTDVIGSMPYQAFTEQPGGTQMPRTPTPPLLSNPSTGPNSRVVVYSSIALDAIWHGNGIGIVWTRDEFGEPDIVVPVPAEYVFVKYKDEYDNIPLFRNGEIVYLIGDKAYRPEDIIHWKGLCRPNALRGMGVLEQHLRTLGLDAELRKQAGSSSGAGVPTGVLETLNPDLESADLLAIRDGWMAAQSSRKVAVLGPGVKYQALAWNPTEAQLLEARKFSHVEIALIFGVDPEWLGAAQSSRTYQNIEQAGIELVRRSSLAGHLARWEAELSRHLRPGSIAKANLDSVQRADTKSRYEAHAIGITSGFLTDDEVRAKFENLPPLTPEQREQIKASKPEPALPPAGDKPADQQDDKTKQDDEKDAAKNKGDQK